MARAGSQPGVGYNDAVTATSYDAVVVGSGPAGSVAALVLARGGARVALVDKAAFPRDKACGDLVGPRGIQLLDDLGIHPSGTFSLGDMVVTGPTGGRVRLPARAGRDYPGHGWAIPRRDLDAQLHHAALEAGAEPVEARAAAVVVRTFAGSGRRGDAEPSRVVLAGGQELLAAAVIGADGANSAVAEQAGLVDPGRVLWGFAIRVYMQAEVELPVISLWDPSPGRGFPGYGWLFPGPDGRANAGLGLGTGCDRRGAATATRHLGAFLDHLRHLGLLAGNADPEGTRLGGWLKMGMVGTLPARGSVLLVGDAAGLVNPLQGEGISQAMDSGQAAARAVLAGPSGAAAAYRRHLRRHHLAYQGTTGAFHASLLDRPRAISVLGRALTGPGVGRLIGGPWALYWNDLVAGGPGGLAGWAAAAADVLARAATANSRTRRWLRTALAD